MTDQYEKGIKELLAKRFYGAASISGFNYQILYSIYWALLELPNTEGAITLEGIEDIDGIPSLKGVNSEVLNVQVKYRSSSLTWSDFTRALLSYAESYSIDPRRSLRVVSNNEPAPHVRQFLYDVSRGNNKDKKLKHKLIAAGIDCNKQLFFFKSIDVQTMPSAYLEDECLRLINQINPCSIDTAKLSLTSITTWFYQCAAKRMTLYYSDIQAYLVRVFEALSISTYDAFGQGLIERVSWDYKSETSRFFDGSSVYPGDIRDGLDVVRYDWLEKIKKAFLKSHSVIIKAPSGQGKSVLMLRYAYEFGNLESTYTINQLNSAAEVVSVGRFLEAINHIGIPSLILIDSISNQVSMWDKLVSSYNYDNLYFLMATREDNWHFYVSHIANYELLDLDFTRKDAHDIFRALKSKGHVINDRLTASGIFDTMGGCPLLLEFVYMCTSGSVLKHRLADQLNDTLMSDPISLGVLRLISVSDMIGTGISIEQIEKILEGPIEQSLRGLLGEFVKIENGLVTGLHVVRSRHVVDIIHDEMHHLTRTISKLFKVYQSDQLTMLVYYIITKNVSSVHEVSSFMENAHREHTIQDIVAVVEALYQCGIDRYVENNKHLVKEAYTQIGISGIMILVYEFIRSHDDPGSESLFDVFHDKLNFQVLKQIFIREDLSFNGMEYVNIFLDHFTLHDCDTNFSQLGRLLEWCSISGCKLVDWDTYSKRCIVKIDFNETTLGELSSFTYGLFCYSKEDYHTFIDLNREGLLGFLKYNLDCYDIQESSNTVTIKFISCLTEYSDLTNQAVPRLTDMYHIFPFYDRYISDPYEYIMDGVKITHSNNVKGMLPKYIHSNAKVNRNKLLMKKFIQAVLPNLVFYIDDYWQSVRQQSYSFASEYSIYLSEHFKGNSYPTKKIDNIILLCNTVSQSLKYAPVLSSIASAKVFSERVDDLLTSKELQNWSSSLYAFYTQLITYLETSGESITLSLYNLKKSIKDLMHVQDFLSRQYHKYGVIYNSGLNDVEEISVYESLHSLLFLKYEKKFNGIIDDPIAYVKKDNIKNEARILEEARAFFDSKTGLTTGTSLVHTNELVYLPLQYECNSVDSHLEDMFNVLELFVDYKSNQIDGFWFVPVYNNRMFMNEGYMLYKNVIDDLLNDSNKLSWETFMPISPPDEVINRLPCRLNAMIPIEVKPIDPLLIETHRNSILKCFLPIVENLPEINEFEKKLKNRYINKLSEYCK